MQTNVKNNSLTKKVLFSIVAAGMLSGFALSAEADNHIELFKGQQRNETPVDVSWIFVNRFENDPNPVFLTLNGGNVTGGDGDIDESGGETTVFKQLRGSTGYPHTKSQTGQILTSCDVAAYAKGIGQLMEATNVNFTGEIAANADNVLEDKANVIINGGSITAGKYYYNDPTTGQPKSEDNATYVTAFNKGKIELTNVVISSNISAYSGGKITVKDSNVNAAKEIRANGQAYELVGNVPEPIGQRSEINIDFDANKKGTVTVGSQILAEAGAKISITNANINVTNTYGPIEATGKDSTGAGSQITLNNSTITAYGLNAESGGELTLAENSKATVNYIAAQKGGTLEIKGNVTAESVSTNSEGKIYFTGGANTVYEVTDRFTVSSDSLYIYGGTLKSNKLKSLNDSSATIEKDGIISTMSNNIYQYEASATEQDSGAITNKGILFTGGTLILNDEVYTMAYAQSAQAKLAEKGNTQLTMAGELVGENGNTQNTTPIDEIATDENSYITYDKVTARADGNLLIGSDSDSNMRQNIDGVTVKDKVKNGFAVGSLDLAFGSNGVIITNDKEVTLGGSQGGSLITVNGEDKDITLVIGTTGLVNGSNSPIGTLNIGNALATADTKYTLNGEVIVNPDSNLNIKGQTEITNSLTLNKGTVDVKTGSLKTKDLIISGTSNLFGTVNAESLEVKENEKLLIGDAEKAGKLTVEKATLNDTGMVFLDPTWKDGMTIGDASGFALTDVSSALDGTYVAGRNSVLAFGADLAAAEAKFAKTGYTWGGGDEEISAAAYIAKSVDLGTGSITGSITVNGSLASAPAPAFGGTLVLADNSLLIVDAAQTKTEAAIKGVTIATIDGGSTLFIDGAKKDETYHILAGTASAINNAWVEDAIESNNSLLKFTNANLTGEYALTASIKSIDEAFGTDQVTASNAYDAALKAQDEGDAAYDFIMAAVDSKVNAGEVAQASALNSAAAMSELAGVEHGTYAASNLLTDAVSDYLSLANAKDHDSDIWAKYIHTKENVDGLAIANFGAKYDAQYNGIVVGADLYKNGKAAIGAALTYVDGNINGNTLAARTKNDATYYGASIYGGIQNDDSAVIGDISYLHGKNDITQYNSGKTLTADAKSDAFSIGVRAEKSVKAGVGKFVPYAGLRYMHLGTGNYTNSIGMSYDGDDMNLWLLPVGVKYSADVKTGSWTIRPIAEVGYVWNMGDRSATQTISLNGASDGFGYDVADSGSYIGRFMIEAEKANVTYGLGYEYQKGDSVKANRWMAKMNWSF